jgi:hypothetical protein
MSIIPSSSLSFPIVGSEESLTGSIFFGSTVVSIDSERIFCEDLRADIFVLSHIHHAYTSMGILFFHSTI